MRVLIARPASIVSLIAIGLVGCTVMTGADELVVQPSRGERKKDVDSTNPNIPPEREGSASSSAKGKAETSTNPEVADGGGSGASEDAASPGTSNTPSPEPVLCGETSCAPGKPCCVEGLNRTCSTTDSCGTTGVAVRCDGRAGCGTDELCCFEPALSGAQCKAQSACTGLVFCKTDSDCPAGRTCLPMGGSFSERGQCG